MKYLLISFVLHGLLAEVLSWSAAGHTDVKSICSWKTIHTKRTKCPGEQFQCLNSGNCISRSWYCDRGNDCGDNSDESYCATSELCPTNPLFVRCDNSDKCIPYEWVCNGYNNCPNEDDERNCGAFSGSLSRNSSQIQTDQKWVINALSNISKWLQHQKMESFPEKWGPNVDRFALLHYFADNKINQQQNTTKIEIAYELRIQMLSRLTRTTLANISSTELASYVNSFLVTCSNPRDFHGYNIVSELRNRVNEEEYTNPYVLLALCNAGEVLTEADKNKLTDTFYNSRRTFWTDMQAVSVMALACANKQPGNEVSPDTLRNMTLQLKQHQYTNGTVVNLPATALVMQALIAIDTERDSDNFDEINVLQTLVLNQKSDGSFGDLVNTLFVAPILTCRSLIDINSNHCNYKSRDENSALQDLSRRTGPKKRVQYSLWIGNEKDLERNLVLRVPEDMSLYGVMEIAAEVDSQFKFNFWVKDDKPYINAVSGMKDDPLTGKFWFLYTLQDYELTLSNESPADIIPTENDHYVLWYRSGTWVD